MDKQHHSADGDYLIKAAIDADKAKLEKMGITKINIRYVAISRFPDMGMIGSAEAQTSQDRR